MPNSNILGIDVSKTELVIFDQAVNQTVKVPNSEYELKAAIKDYDWNPATYLVGLESTGDYSFLPMRVFLEAGFTVKLLNPITTKRFIKSTVRNKKTDKSDALAIATLITYGEGQIVTENQLNASKKTLLRLESKLTGIKTQLQLMKQALELKSDNGLHLERAVKKLNCLIEKVEETAENIWDLTKQEKLDHQEEIIASHVGCGEKLSAIISAEAGDIKRFPSPKQFKAYAGIDPKVIQSGQKDVKGKMTKRGNSLLRQALYLAAFVASVHDPELRQYYLKKRSEGKSHTHAVCTVARKLCERIYATVTQDRMYEVRYPQGVT